MTAAPKSKGDTPLHYAARGAGNTLMIVHLMEVAGRSEKAWNLARMRNARGETALHEAIYFAHLEMVDALTSEDSGVALRACATTPAAPAAWPRAPSLRSAPAGPCDAPWAAT
ncbi:protein ACCELERATED CELL DEATH 6-like [Panicum miliaceum]|uniref:Protein ACCELERATED CELL DEATH 6-like n=1 Tax=Panicum miliaceum TaxID=4540 RepID=A0A3L6RYG5_PANMI|nr:protein ACCELERATED CELL DEATH 6-like [Panicum miliaceum]